MKKTCLAALALLLNQLLFAQGNITGKLVDSANNKPLYLATVTIYKAADTSIVTYRLSDKDGLFKVPGLPANIPLRALVSF